ncbi:LINE-1 retrotransposable element ORF2 protein [Bienertia sinuspersici]
MKSKIRGPWLLMGDINCVLNIEERIGSNVRLHEMLPGRKCFETCGLKDIPYGGNFFTWSNKQASEDRVFSKIDRVMANEDWMDEYEKAKAIFLPEGVSDHCPAVIRMGDGQACGQKPFKYFRMWSQAPDYKERVKRACLWEGQGTDMYSLTRRLKQVKKELKDLNKHGFSSIQAVATKAYQELIDAQQALHDNPRDERLATIEKEASQQYKQKQDTYVQFLKQKAKCHWLKEGDSNTKLFHRSIKQRRIQNNVYAIRDMTGDLKASPDDIAEGFQQYYTQLLGTSMRDREQVQRRNLEAGPVLNEDQRLRLLGVPTVEEVKAAMFSIKGDKAPGPDGFGSFFFQDNWDIVGKEVYKAVSSFFTSGKILKELNTTFLSLIPKVKCPRDVSEFRPIACCNTVYKCITKILCSRLKNILPDLIAENQGAFVHGRFIVHNIMVCQDLVRRYGRKNTGPSCMIKLDLRKAYDTVEWDFVREMLLGLNFPIQFTDWVMECISTPMFSLVLNGTPHGFFKSKRGLRQGDPLSPLIFVLCMEYLSRTMRRMAEDKQFKFHLRCKAMALSHLCFADDLILCCKGETYSIQKILKSFHHFSKVSGLIANNSKTEVYSCGMKEEEINNIIEESGFKKGSLPFKYLGVPICSKRINVSQCEKLIEQMTARIRIWSSKHLSFAGRSQLINSILLTIHQYWAQVFVLPASVLRSIEQLCTAFLWSGVWYSTAPGYISWENVCKEKKVGGLGFRDIQKWNIATMARHVWAVANKQDNLWVKWIHSVYIKEGDWWGYEPPKDGSWYWKKVCEIKRILFNAGLKDTLLSMRKFSVKAIYQQLITNQDKVSWASNIWSRYNVPKHSFCLWLAVQQRLPTTDRLSKWGAQMQTTCGLCGTGQESSEHLFFQCPFSMEVWEELKAWLNSRNAQQNIQGICKWINRKNKKAKVERAAWNLALSAATYHIWQNRNAVQHGKLKKGKEHVVAQVKYQICQRLQLINVKKLSSREKNLIVWLNSS